MADLTVVIPSRGRPQAVKKLVDAFRETGSHNARIIFVVDADDPTRHDYLAAIEGTLIEPKTDVTTFGQPERNHLVGCGVVEKIVVSHGSNMAEALNVGVQHALDGYAVAFMGDDHRPRTWGWDTAYLQALRGTGTGIVYGNDLLQGEALPTQVAMTTDIVRALGWMTPPGMRHMYLDNFWRDLGAAAGCLRYLPDVVVEHLHPAGGKARMDEGYIRVNAPEMYEHDRQAYSRYLAERFRQDVATVKALRAVSHV